MENDSRITTFDVINYFVLSFLVFLVIAPFLYVLMGSFISPDDYFKYGITFPKHFSLYNYKQLLGPGSRLLTSYGVTTYITLFGTFISLLLTSMLAYGLSKKNWIGRNTITTLIFFTMLFNGGLIPTFLLIKSLGMLNTLWSLMIPNAIAVWYLFIMRNFFIEIPDSLEESAKIDGANDFVILIRIIYPLSMPVLATIGLFYAVERWNTWFDALMYLSNYHKFPLQLVLNDIINFNSSAVDPSMIASQHDRMPSADILKMTAIIVSIVPILCVYPFIQKYFVKGVMIGSVKG